MRFSRLIAAALMAGGIGIAPAARAAPPIQWLESVREMVLTRQQNRVERLNDLAEKQKLADAADDAGRSVSTDAGVVTALALPARQVD